MTQPSRVSVKVRRYLRKTGQLYRKVAVVPCRLRMEAEEWANGWNESYYGSKAVYGDILYRGCVLLTPRMAQEWLEAYREVRRVVK